MAHPVTGCHCRYCRLHGKESKRHGWKSLRRMTKKSLRDGTEPPKSVSNSYGCTMSLYDVPRHDFRTVYD